MTVSSPASSGPAGAHFEGQVGAHYLLSLLIGTEPLGLPGTRVERVELQRAAEGHPLDDIVVHARDLNGDPAVMEVQVKRSLLFAPSDQEFRSVVAQIAKASQHSGFFDRRHELAVAVGRVPLTVQGPYRDVLTWARQMGSAATFMTRIERPHSANADMRRFVGAFKTHLKHAGAAHDDETVWRLLSRLRILHFDFTVQESEHESWQRERAAHALHSDDTGKAGALWKFLVELAIETAASGGDRDRDRLLQEVRAAEFRLAGDRRYATARSALAEDARHALEDISDRVGSVRLARGEQLAVVRKALDKGRYVEIRGEPGVGKSGLLKRLAEDLSTQSCVIVLRPGRVASGGWWTMRTALGFDGTAHELLVDLAAAGGAILFVDGLDSFSEEERPTVVDLVGEASKIPGFSVVATTWRRFGGEDEEPEWLSADALDRLGRAAPVTVGQLDTEEIAELCDAAPELAPLLADTHPARAIACNLFRLERLARRPDGDRQIRTEVDMAEDWWGTADGKEEGRRKRARSLKALAKQALASVTLNAGDHPAKAVDALVRSGTLRDLGSDRMVFRHDVLRDWAVANLLFEEPDAMGVLPLDRPAPARLVRGFELATRMKLERAADNAGWSFLLDGVSQEGMHGSWRRAVLLAVVRSEIGIELLNQVTEPMLAEDARLLRELIRTVQAVEVRPLSERLTQLGMTGPKATAVLYLPSAPSWDRLIVWLLALGDDLPEAATGDVAALLTASCAGIFDRGETGSMVAGWFYHRLEGIEVRWSNPLVRELHSGFLAVCHNVPSLATRYLNSLAKCRWHDGAIRTVWSLSSSVARVAPQELADLTVALLIPGRKNRELRRPSGIPVSLSDLTSSGSDYREREPFGSSDLAFTPPSPTHGPFLALLDHAPAIGLKLIRRLVDHAIAVRSRGQPHGIDEITVAFAEGGRVFSSIDTYMWSRVWGNGDPCVQSALMALEDWAHRRIAGGEDVEAVLADVLPSAGGPAAYLLVAVDILLSHWPKSREAAIPFLACPELLCLDLQRMSGDTITRSDVFMLSALFETTYGPFGFDGGKTYPSRKCSLDSLFGRYVISGSLEMRIEIAGLLRQTVERLGPYGEDAGRLHPEFMAVQALNYLDPTNWRETSAIGPDGEPIGAWEYVSPPEESEHLEQLRGSSPLSLADQEMQTALLEAVTEPSRSSSQFALQAMDWVLRPAPPTGGEAWDNAKRRNLATIAAAVVAMRDGDRDLRARHHAWARGIFVKALDAGAGDSHIPASNIKSNPIAMTFVGIVQLLRGGVEPADVRGLLGAASRPDSLTVSGFRVAAGTIAAMDERLPRALLRTAFASCFRSRRHGIRSREDQAADIERRAQSAVDRELSWLFGEREEPEWPAFPMVSPVRRSSNQISFDVQELQEKASSTESHAQMDEYLDSRSAASWLNSAYELFDVDVRPWLRGLAETYAEWTAVANGSGLNPHDSIMAPSEWNAAYYNLVAHCLPGLATEDVNRLAVDPIRSLPDDSFFNATSHFLRSVDRVYFGSQDLAETEAVRIRMVLAERLSSSYRWTSGSCGPSASIEVDMGSSIAAFFFNNWNRLPLSSCYLLPQDVARVEAFLPVLEHLAVEGSGGFVAGLVLDLIEVSPNPEHLSFIATAAEAWLSAHPNNTRFWIDTGIAQRLCAVIENIGTLEPHSCRVPVLRDRVSHILSALVGMGVPAAGQLEQNLAEGVHE